MGIRDPYVLTRDGMKVPTYEEQHDNLTTVPMAPCRCESIEWVCAAWAREHTAELRASASVDISALREVQDEILSAAVGSDTWRDVMTRWADEIEKALKGRKSE